MMRMDSNGKSLVCRNCLDRKPLQKRSPQEKANSKAQKQDELMKEYFCKACKYNFNRAKHIVVSNCPYCGSKGSVMVKGSTARIIADVSKMKGD